MNQQPIGTPLPASYAPAVVLPSQYEIVGEPLRHTYTALYTGVGEHAQVNTPYGGGGAAPGDDGPRHVRNSLVGLPSLSEVEGSAKIIPARHDTALTSPHPSRPSLPSTAAGVRTQYQAPRRAATLPSTPNTESVTSDHVHSCSPTSDAAAAHHRSLVAYYWHFAQQGYAAPLTAPQGSVEWIQQERARRESVEWAKTCGITVVDPTTPAPIPSASVANSAPPQSPGPVGVIKSSRPLPAVPATTIPVPFQDHTGGLSSDQPLVANRVAAESSTSGSGSQPSKTPHGRPLPAPPIEKLTSGLNAMTVAAPRSVIEASKAAPPTATIAPADELSTGQSGPAPSFRLTTEDNSRPPSPPAAVPTFSFDGPDVADASPPLSPMQENPLRHPDVPLHPRHDPSHPSHKLYHPTSVLPSSSSASDPSATPSAASLPEAGTLSCTACDALIFGRVLVALGKEWHPDCFRCAEEGCGARLEVMEFEGTPEDWEEPENEEQGEAQPQDRAGRPSGKLGGKAWCMVHFEERFALECYHCQTPIASADYLPIHDPQLPPRSSYRHASTRFYHPLHFFCSGCGDPFIDPVSYEMLPTASALMTAAADLDVRPYVPREGHPYCDTCDLRIWRPKCVGCRKGLKEEDGFLEIDGVKWHDGCFKCSMCNKPLTGVYLLRRSASTSGLADDRDDEKEEADGSDELPFCGECYDIKAEEEAKAALAGR